MDSVAQLLAQIVLLVPPNAYQPINEDRVDRLTKAILEGKYADLIEISDFKELSSLPSLQAILARYPNEPLLDVLKDYVTELVKNGSNLLGESYWFSLETYAVAFLQLFIQVNYTGPPVNFSAGTLWFPHADQQQLQTDCVRALDIEGQQAYDLMQDPIHLIVAKLILEKLLNLPTNFSLSYLSLVIDSLDKTMELSKNLVDTASSPKDASIIWWLVRALQVHSNILSEPSSVLSSISGVLFNEKILTHFSAINQEHQKLLRTQFLLEQARIHIHAQTEHAATAPLLKATELSGLQILLSGAKAKRTKFQKFTTSNLIVLAKSQGKTAYDDSEKVSHETFDLNSDLLLEKPEFETLEDLQLEVEDTSKRIKLDYGSIKIDLEENRLLPIAMRQEYIPEALRELDPNNQPALNCLDVLQILLRFQVIKQTSPADDPLISEELFALVARVIYHADSDGVDVNWLLFARALWERSLLESGKSRTVERGILQMTSLIEEMGLKIKSRVIPTLKEVDEQDPLMEASKRLRFIHQLPLLSQWAMDIKLAEKYMSLGIIKSALEIYERLELPCEAALCYAATDREREAEEILEKRLEENPKDARAMSILGDIRQDPTLWQMAWDTAHYAKAKASMSHYYHSPPPSSGLTRDLQLAISNMFESLSANPLNYENWFFYGCCGLEGGNFELASEAFTRCVSLDDSNSYAWSNLASALIKLDKTKPAFNALQKAIRCGGDKKSWRIYENYLNVAVKLNEWNDVLMAYWELLQIRKDEGDGAIDIPVLEKLSQILLSSDYPQDESTRLTHFQKSCIKLICEAIPEIITSSARCWNIVARVELWRKRPWAALECHEKAYRALLHSPDLDSNEETWNEVVEACENLVSAFESLGELPGKHGAGDVVCKDWRYKARMTIRSLMSKGKHTWEDSTGWEKLETLKDDLS